MDNLEEKLGCVERNLEYIESLEEAVIYTAIDVFNYCSKVRSELEKRGIESNRGLQPSEFTRVAILKALNMVNEANRVGSKHPTRNGG